MGSTILEQVEANVDEVLVTESFVDIYPLLPSVFSPEDVEIIIKETLKRTKRSIHIYATTIVVSEAFLQNIYKKLEPFAEKKAKELVDSGKWLQSIAESRLKSKSLIIGDNKTDRKAERRKKAVGGKTGGGTQGRETKTKSTKKKYQVGKNQEADSEEENTTRTSSKSELTLITVEEISTELRKDPTLDDIDDLVEELATHLQLLLNKHVAQVAEQLMQKSKVTNLNEIEDKLNMIAMSIRVFDKGIKHLEKSVQMSMVKYLLRTLCVDFLNDIFKLAAQQNVIQCSTNFTTEARQKLLLEFPKDIRENLNELHKAVAGESIDDFLNAIEPSMVACCLVLKKHDKKKERPVIVGHREALLEQLNCTQDPALALQLTTNILFIATTQSALHMSGRHVSNILNFLHGQLEPETVSVLNKYHGTFFKYITSLKFKSTKYVNILSDNFFSGKDNLIHFFNITKKYGKRVTKLF